MADPRPGAPAFHDPLRKRAPLPEALADGPTTQRYLRETLDISRSTVYKGGLVGASSPTTTPSSGGASGCTTATASGRPRPNTYSAARRTVGMADDDISLDEKRVYADRTGATTAYVATGAGVARVEVSADIVGEFALAERCIARDVAADGRLAVATGEDVLVGTASGFEPTGFGPADAVGYGDGLLAAGDGRLARYDGGWETLARLADVRAIDGDLVAAADGVYRTDGTHVGLDGATDVAASGGPLAATDSGLYYLANGWMPALEGPFDVVATGPDVAHAAGGDGLYERRVDGEWRRVDLPVAEPVVGVAYGDATYVVTERATFLANAGDGWRHRSLGLPDVVGVAVP